MASSQTATGIPKVEVDGSYGVAPASAAKPSSTLTPRLPSKSTQIAPPARPTT
jgi:hypothetical protein